MKRIYSFMFAAVAAFAAASCAQELDNQLPEGEKVVFEASVDGADTKVTLDGKVSKWESGDKITIHNGTKGYEFSTTDEGVKAEFSYVGDDFSGDKFLAVYPAGEYTADVENKTVTANIPTYQPSRENDFSVGAVPSVAYAENNSLAFKNASALLKFTVKGTNVKGLVFYGNNNEAVSGNIKVSLDENNTVESVEALETTITENNVTETKLITWAKVWAQTDDYCFNEGVTYYLSVVPQNFEKGFTAQLEVDGVGTVDVKKLETGYDLKPNTILDLGELEYVAPAPSNNWGIAGTMTDWADKADIPMSLEGDWYVAKNVTIKTADSFKFRTDGTWGNERTCEGPVAADKEVAVAAGAGNITVAVSAVYDVYLSKNADKMKLVKVGDVNDEEPATSEWVIPGAYNEWDATAPMTKDGDYFVAKGLTKLAVADGNGFKFIHNGTWLGYGEVNAGAWVTASSAGGDIKVKGATANDAFDVYLNPENLKFVLVVAGEAMPDDTPAIEPDPEDDVTVYFKPNKSLVSSAKCYAAWSWKGTGEGKWYSLTDPDADGVYEAAIPSTNDNIIFAAMNSTTVNWDNKTYQTADLQMPTDNKNCYLVATDKWVTVDEAKAYVEQTPYKFYVQDKSDWGTIAFYTWGGTYTNTWPGDKMTKTETVEGYGTCKYVEIPYGKTIVNFIINNNGGGKQTDDLTVAKNATKLASGDYIYVHNK